MAAAAAVGASVLVGCGGSSTTVTVTSSSPSTPTTSSSLTSSSLTSTALTSTSSTLPDLSGVSTTTASRRPAPTVHLVNFKSPSGNIGCIMYADGARCDIKQRSWSPPRRPASCTSQVDFGQGVAINQSSGARIVCAGDTTLDPSARPLPYGTDSLIAGFRCQSRADGVTCRSVQSGHGFFISFQSYRLF